MILCFPPLPVERIGASAGSVATILNPGMRLRKNVERPEIVPPVPVVQITA